MNRLRNVGLVLMLLVIALVPTASARAPMGLPLSCDVEIYETSSCTVLPGTLKYCNQQQQGSYSTKAYVGMVYAHDWRNFVSYRLGMTARTPTRIVANRGPSNIYSCEECNAAWNEYPQLAMFGDGTDSGCFNPIVYALDIVGHELIHGENKIWNPSWSHCGEQAAINEGAAYFLGEALERYRRPWETAWEFGENVQGVRHLANPYADGFPGQAWEQNWGGGCAYAAYYNASLIAKWLQLMASGGYWLSDYVQAIGETVVAKTVARTLKYRTSPTTGFCGFVNAFRSQMNADYGYNPAWNASWTKAAEAMQWHTWCDWY